MPILSGATTFMGNITRNSFIMGLNEALYHENKLNYSQINPNKLICYGTIIWDNPFDPTKNPCIYICEGNKIYIILDCTNIGFRLHILTEEEIRNLPNIEMKYSS